MTRSVEGQSEQLRKDICKEMEGVAAETDVAFTTNFWTSPIAESFMMMSMHWITQDWCLKTRIMGTINFPQQHTATNISDKLMDLRLDLEVYPRGRDGRHPQSLQVMRKHKVFYFKEEHDLDKLVLTSDCGSDVFVGAKRDRLWDWNWCACHCLNIAVQAVSKEEVVHKCLALLMALAARFSKSRSLWNKVKKMQMGILDQEEECNDDEGEADSDKDKDLEVGGEGEPPLKKVLQLIRPMPTRWNSTYYLVKRALVFKDALVQFADCHRPCPGEHSPTIPIDDNVEVFIRSCPWTTTLFSSSLCSKVVSPQVVMKYHVFNVEYWWSYKDLEQCMEPIKQLSVLLESSTEATIHDMLDYFLRLLYNKLERAPKRRVELCTMFNTFVNTFRQKLMMLLDDVQQFFLWVVAAALDGRKTNFD